MSATIRNTAYRLVLLGVLASSVMDSGCRPLPGPASWTFKGQEIGGVTNCGRVAGSDNLYRFTGFATTTSIEDTVDIMAEAVQSGAVVPGTYPFTTASVNELRVHESSGHDYRALSGQAIVAQEPNGYLRVTFDAVVVEGDDEQPISGELLCNPASTPPPAP